MKSVTIDNITDLVIAAMSPDMAPRTKEVLTNLIQHLHDFARDVRLTHEEWLIGIDFLSRAGKMTDEKRNEFILISDILGLESLADAISHNAHGNETESAVLGPFFREGAPVLPAGASIAQRNTKDGPAVSLRGRITNAKGEPVAGAIIDVWETGPDGFYEQQDPNQPDMNLRGRFKTDDNGDYDIMAVRPVSYPIPYDGPAGDLLQIMGRHPYRPAHIHMVVVAPGYKKLISQLYDRQDTYLESDAVFAVKGSLIVDFKPARDNSGAEYLVEHNVVLKADDGTAVKAV
ncbi:MAG: intradiol ring-cleavage dioxygenase [Rhodospirillales bacterium]|nr:intradiol ring-cleavage dioxygenase [Rhodospirillales bacterium]